ncbi:transposase [Providencia alcalifaciens]|uniref:Transposase n=1 Tax=Providencia alcalifaciens TaxID=126385 RepID=A0A4R3NFR7_9GAMM|nr:MULTISPECIES: IS110 family transposase [Providencia]MBC5792373.1 IS110 family transposase [Providencia sp. JUb39]TCT28830.1 transposase [Providencia alcalifaciens]
MENITLIGLDLGKNSFHIHGQNSHGKAIYRKKFTRAKLFQFLANCPATTIVMEACGGAHFMVRKLTELGHCAKLISLQFVRPFVKSNKNDFIDAEAICEAASRPSMRFVKPRTESQQAMHALHRVRESLVRDRVKTTNQMHAFLLEFGVSAPKGAALIKGLTEILETNEFPPYLESLLQKLREHYDYLLEQIKDLETQLKASLNEDCTGQRLLSIPCVGPLTASLLSTHLGDGKQYGDSREFAASTGLVPRQYSTGGRNTLLGISKRGNKKLRALLVQCARVYLRTLAYRSGKLADWVKQLLQRKNNFVVTCALANKLARIVWALTTRQQSFDSESS